MSAAADDAGQALDEHESIEGASCDLVTTASQMGGHLAAPVEPFRCVDGVQ